MPSDTHDPAQNVEAEWPSAVSVPTSSMPAAEESWRALSRATPPAPRSATSPKAVFDGELPPAGAAVTGAGVRAARTGPEGGRGESGRREGDGDHRVHVMRHPVRVSLDGCPPSGDPDRTVSPRSRRCHGSRSRGRARARRPNDMRCARGRRGRCPRRRPGRGDGRPCDRPRCGGCRRDDSGHGLGGCRDGLRDGLGGSGDGLA